METIIIKINPRSKAGSLLKAVLETVYSKLPGIEIVQEKNPYNPEFVRKIKESEKQKGRLMTTAEELWNSIE